MMLLRTRPVAIGWVMGLAMGLASGPGLGQMTSTVRPAAGGPAPVNPAPVTVTPVPPAPAQSASPTFTPVPTPSLARPGVASPGGLPAPAPGLSFEDLDRDKDGRLSRGEYEAGFGP